MSVIAIDATSQSSGSGTTITWSHSTAGQNRYLIVGATAMTGSFVSSVTYNSVAMTRLVRAYSGSSYPNAELWGLPNPTTGANNIIVTFNNAPTAGATVSGVSYNYVSQFSAIATSGSASGSSTAPLVFMTANSIVGIIGESGSATFTAGASQTQRVNYTTGSGVAAIRNYTADRLNLTSGTQYISGSLSAVRGWAAVGIALNASLPNDEVFKSLPMFTRYLG